MAEEPQLHDGLPVESGCAYGIGQRHDGQHNRELTQLNAQVERDQGDGARSGRQAHVGEHGGESEAMQKAKGECDSPAAFGDFREDVV